MERDFGQLPTAFEEIRFFVGSDVLFKPFYGKLSVVDKWVLHGELFFILGVTVFNFNVPDDALGRAFRPGVNLGIGGRVFLSKVLSLRLDVSDNVVIPLAAGQNVTNVMAMALLAGHQHRRHRVRKLLMNRSLLPFLLTSSLAALAQEPSAAATLADAGVGDAAAAAAAAAPSGPGGSTASTAAPQPKKIDPKLFDAALKDYFTGHPKDAAPKLFDYTENLPSTDENYAWAQFFLAKSLIELRLRHAGAVYLARIARERTNPAVLPKALEELQKLTDLPARRGDDRRAGLRRARPGLPARGDRRLRPLPAGPGGPEGGQRALGHHPLLQAARGLGRSARGPSTRCW